MDLGVGCRRRASQPTVVNSRTNQRMLVGTRATVVPADRCFRNQATGSMGLRIYYYILLHVHVRVCFLGFFFVNSSGLTHGLFSTAGA